MDKTAATAAVKAKAKELGFLHAGISKAEFLAAEAGRLESWLANGKHGKMAYMENHFDARLDPRLLIEGAKSVISLSVNYYNPEKQKDLEAPKISSYAYGEDYHVVIREQLALFCAWIKEYFGDVSLRAFVDSAPVLERAWAERSGLGWRGKNTNLISKKSGSFFFLAEIICDLELSYDYMATDHCGTCTRCIDACPTDALSNSYVLDASKCISYLTIELKEEIPEAYLEKMQNWAFGCDICQQVCPWNRFSIPHNEPRFLPSDRFLRLEKEEWKDITHEFFLSIFKNLL